MAPSGTARIIQKARKVLLEEFAPLSTLIHVSVRCYPQEEVSGLVFPRLERKIVCDVTLEGGLVRGVVRFHSTRREVSLVVEGSGDPESISILLKWLGDAVERAEERFRKLLISEGVPVLV